MARIDNRVIVAEARIRTKEWTEYRCPVCQQWGREVGLEITVGDSMVAHIWCPSGHAFDVSDGVVTMIDTRPVQETPRITDRWGISP